MSSANVLYDAPGPRARREAAIGGAIATLAFLALVGLVVKRLADAGQFAGKLWGPILNPSDESFPLVWNLLAKGAEKNLFGYYTGEAGVWDKIVRAYESKGKHNWRGKQTESC